MEQKLKILWHSNAPNASTGYGNQTGLFAPRLLDDFELVISGFYGVEGVPQRFRLDDKEVLVVPRAFHSYGDDVLGAHMSATDSDVCVSLIDPFALQPTSMDPIRWAAWVPVDSAPVSPENQRSLRAANHLWSMSKFGHAQLQQFVNSDGWQQRPSLHYVPHGIDSKVYKPSNRLDSRQKLQNGAWHRDIEDKFIVTTVAANKGYPGRKNWPGMFMVMATFLAQHPDAVWYIHTNTAVPMGHGDDIPLLMSAYNLNSEQVIAPPPYQYMVTGYPPAYLADVYNAADVFLLMSFGEGFGIPIVEAQMTGCPVIVTDGTAMKELCMAGDAIPSEPIQALDGRQGCLWAYPSKRETLTLLNKHYDLWKQKDTRLRTQAREKSLIYDVDTVYSTYMKPALEVIARAVLPQTDSRKRRKKSSMGPLVVQPENGKPTAAQPGTVTEEKEPAA